MRKSASLTSRIISMLLAIILVFYTLPLSVIAQEIKDSKASTTTPSNTSEGQNSTDNNSTTQIPYTYYNEVYEEASLREESVKHFRLEDGSYVAAQYASPVHYLDENGEWQNIDNTLAESGSEFVTSDARVKFIKKTTGNGNIFTLHDGNTKITLSLAGANKKVSGIVTNTEESETTEIGKLMSLEGLSSRIRYNEILDGVDIEYVLDSLSIKENIIIKEKRDAYAYTFTLSLNGLEAELLENGDISITKNGEQKYTIPAPVVFDAADSTAPVDAASYSLIDNGNGKYTLTVSVSSEWMNSLDRVYPVTLDPAIITGSSYIIDTYGEIGIPSSNGLTETLQASSSKIILMSVRVPIVPRGAKISNVSLSLYKTSGTGSYIGAYLLEGSYGLNSYDVANAELGELIDYCHTAGSTENPFVWNVTKAVETYPTTAYLDLALTSISGNGTTTFASSEYTESACRPALDVYYVNTLGLEDYYSYSMQSGGAAGTGYVNYATGDLTFAIGTLTSTDYLMPVTPTLVYNSALANSKYTSSTVNTAYTASCMPNGFKLNLQETLVKRSQSSTYSSITFYVWTDADGTEHFFYPTDTENIYRDDSGLLLELDLTTSTNPTITDINKNVRTFARFDSNINRWRLSEISDKIGNKLRLVYNSNGWITTVSLCPNGSSADIAMLSLQYSNDQLYRVTSVASGDAVTFKYSDTYNGDITDSAKEYLRQIEYTHVENTSSGTNVTVTDATMYYEYDANGYLISAKNGLADYTVNYEWTDGKVSSVYEKGGTTQGVKLSFAYGIGYTEVTTPGADGYNSTTADNIINHYSYDNFYRVVSTYSMSYDRGTIYGASGGKYSNSEVASDGTENSSTNSNSAKNRLTESYSIGGSSTNLLLNGDFLSKSDSDPIPYWETSHSTIVLGGMFRDEAITIPCTTSDTYYIYQYVSLPCAGYYTLSFDICSSNTKDIIIEATPSDTDSRVNLDELDETVKWHTVSKTFSVTRATVVKVQISISRKQGATFPTTPYVYLSKIRLEQGIGGGLYNYVKMGDFADTYRTGYTADPTDINAYTFWKGSNNNYISLASNLASPFKTAVKINGSVYDSRYITQTIYTAPQKYLDSFGATDATGNARKSYIVSGFAKVDGTALSNSRSKFALRADVYYYQGEGEDDIVISHYFHFNPDLPDWQFVSGYFTTYKENEYSDPTEENGYLEFDAKFYDVVRKIDIVCEYDYQPSGSVAYFDKISVVDAETSTTSYEYEDGQIAVIRGVFNNEYREYDDEGRLEIVADDSGNLIMYSYNPQGLIETETTYSFKNGAIKVYPYYHYDEDNNRNPLDALTELTPRYKTVYCYNDYGQVKTIETYPAQMNGTDVVQKPGSASIKTENKYIDTPGSPIFGALQTTSDGTGRMLKYFYDTSRGYLLAEVNVGAGTGTAYTYDAIGNLVSARPATCDSEGTSYSTVTGAESVTYSYNTKNELSKITTASSTYTFAYDSFGNLSRFVEGGVRYYYNNAGKLSGVYYLDSDDRSFEYEYYYDKLGRLATEYAWYEEEIGSYEDEDGNVYIEYGYTDILLKEYEYTADGKLYRVYDALNEEYIQYTYDINGRLDGIVTYGTDYINDFATEYYYYQTGDLQGLPSSRYYSFSYLVGSTAIDARISNQYGYDSNERLNSECIERNNVRTQVQYSYDDFSRLSGKKTTTGSLTQQENYGYRTVNGVTTGEVATYTSKVGNNTNTYTYTYDARGNIVSIELNGDLQYDFVYDDLGQLIYEENFITGECCCYQYDNAGNIVLRIDGMECEEYHYVYAPSPFGDRLVSYNGEIISYDSSGRTVVYRGKQITYLQAAVNKIASIGNVSFTYDADGMRRSKTVNGVTHYYTYDGIQLVKEEWGNNVMIFLYDATGSPVGMQYRNSTYAAGVWDIYYYEKNLQGDIVAIYNATGTKLVSYDYDAWGRITSITDGNGNNVRGNASHIGNINPLRYRGYYYDDDLDLYYLATRYYDPEVCRFITADSYVSTGQGILGNNRYAYCNNNPVMYVDYSGESLTAILAVGIAIGAMYSLVTSCLLIGLSEEDSCGDELIEDSDEYGLTRVGYYDFDVADVSIGSIVSAISAKYEIGLLEQIAELGNLNLNWNLLTADAGINILGGNLGAYLGRVGFSHDLEIITGRKLTVGIEFNFGVGVELNLASEIRIGVSKGLGFTLIMEWTE